MVLAEFVKFKHSQIEKKAEGLRAPGGGRAQYVPTPRDDRAVALVD